MRIIDFFTKEEKTFNDNPLNVYVCGPTVYDHAHIGNIRPVLIFDILNRSSNLNYVHNITDIDDKIIKKANELGLTEKEVSEKFEKEYLNLLDSLNIIRPTHMPRVTDNIEGMTNFIAGLIEKGYAYESNGSVYFSVNKLKNYGKIANLNIDTLLDEEQSEDKEDQKDFAIWKATNEGVQFESPWGLGRPGWHTECSYFLDKYFEDKGIDIHGGGIDLKFPHHVNEIAQYEAYHGKEMKNHWVYVGHVSMKDEKMSKSLGNVILAKDFINEYGYDVLKHLLLSTQYLKPVDVTEDSIANSVNTMKKVKNSLIKTMMEFPTEINIEPKPTEESIDAIKNNLDTNLVFTNIFASIGSLNNKEITERNDIFNAILGDLSLLGIEYKITFTENKENIAKAREEKDYETLDKIREGILSC